MLYESALVGVFHYQWGYHDAMADKAPAAEILSNQQSPLDSLLGDVIGRVEGRYFLIEFKRGVEGFHNEVHSSRAKPARTALYAHLRNDQPCRALSSAGHFAAWSNGALRLAPYAHTIGPGALATSQFHELDHRRPDTDFGLFYELINTTDLSPFSQNDALFGKGLGLPANGMLEYRQCMLQNHPDVIEPEAEANAVFGFWNPQTATVVAVPTSFAGLLKAFDDVKRILQPSPSPSIGGMAP